MKKIGLAILASAFMALSLTGCKQGNITVKYYLDYNQVTTEEVYKTTRCNNGDKLKKPKDPKEAPFPEFPVFLGWSKKEVIDNKDDLWDFSTDRVEVKEGYKTFSLYGIWVAEGEE